MAKKDEDVNIMFFIPQNFTDSGKLLGMFDSRKFAEAVIFAGLPGYGAWTFLMPLLGIAPTLCITIFLIVPIFVLCIMGINEDSLLTFLSHVIQFFKNRKKMRFKRIRAYRTIQRIQGNAGASGKKTPVKSSSSRGKATNTRGGSVNASKSRTRSR